MAMARLFILLTVFLMIAGTAHAASSCYNPDEAEAEQGIRIHSELMVIGLNCQHMAYAKGHRNLYSEYRQFTNEHSHLFAGYEEKLMDYYKRTGVANPEAALNTMRTDLANKIALDAARMRPDLFCARYAPRIDKVSTMDNASIRKWAATFFPSHPVSQPVCH
jgi:hypothetical protein